MSFCISRKVLLEAISQQLQTELQNLISDTKSAIVVSISCPIAVIIGILNCIFCLTSVSLLYSIRSSREPPPLAIIIMSDVFFLFIVISCLIILLAQFSP